MGGERAKLFQNGGSQAVRLPKACRFPPHQQVLARREGPSVIIEPADEWPDDFRACLGTAPKSHDWRSSWGDWMQRHDGYGHRR